MIISKKTLFINMLRCLVLNFKVIYNALEMVILHHLHFIQMTDDHIF